MTHGIHLRPNRRSDRPAVTRARRLGAATVEFAAVAPLLLLFILGIIEFGRMMTVQEILTNGAREGARKAALPGTSDADVYSAIDSYMAGAGISGHSRTVTPGSATAQPGTAMRVTVSVPYTSVSWLPSQAVAFLGSSTLTASVEMRKEEY
ncbi:MAG: pilus assembly protein [Planctomycetia bacterium]|nr:pilus assembly protein [Planctomycetia bacterium]